MLMGRLLNSGHSANSDAIAELAISLPKNVKGPGIGNIQFPSSCRRRRIPDSFHGHWPVHEFDTRYHGINALPNR